MFTPLRFPAQGSADAVDLTGARASNNSDGGVVHSMTLLEVQSEQLAVKLQKELDGESPDEHHHSALGGVATGGVSNRLDEPSAAAEEQQPAPGSQVIDWPMFNVPTVRQCHVPRNAFCTLHRQSLAACTTAVAGECATCLGPSKSTRLQIPNHRPFHSVFAAL